jgi:hypothetical protein
MGLSLSLIDFDKPQKSVIIIGLKNTIGKFEIE